MEKFEVIRRNKKISTSDVGTSFYAWLVPIFFICVGIFALYSIYFRAKPISSEETDFIKIPAMLFTVYFFFLLSIYGIYLFYSCRKLLDVKFYKNSSLLKNKQHAIEKIKTSKQWEFKNSDTNYYQFLDTSTPFRWYYITIAFDEQGFYVNCFPFMSRVIDFGSMKKRTNEAYERIKGSL